MKKLHRSIFLKEVKNKFPEIIELINKEDGLLYFELCVFINYVQNKIDAGDKSKVVECFSVLNNYYENGNNSLHSLISNAVSEDILFDDSKNINRRWALDLLPLALKKERDCWYEFMGFKK